MRVGGFERLLSILASDREAAGEKYEVVRLKLLKYFDWRRCPDPPALTDDTLDRVARRLEEGELIRSAELMVYVYGVARNVLLEFWKAQQREERAVADRSLAAPTERAAEESWQADRELDCLETCLAGLPSHVRSLLTRYYEHSAGAKIHGRLELARELGVPINALRIRVHRIKSDLQRCIEKCLRLQK